MKSVWIAGIIAGIVCAPLVAGAYSLESGPSAANQPGGITAPNFNDLLKPLQNFVNGISAVQGGPTPATPIDISRFNLTPPPALPVSFQSAVQSFDAWLYGVAGFHVIGLFTAVLSILSWILGAVKEVVDWLLSAL